MFFSCRENSRIATTQQRRRTKTQQGAATAHSKALISLGFVKFMKEQGRKNEDKDAGNGANNFTEYENKLPKLETIMLNSVTHYKGNAMITQHELANILKCSRVTIWRWRKKPDFPKPFIIGRLLLWDKEEIDNWVQLKKSA